MTTKDLVNLANETIENNKKLKEEYYDSVNETAGMEAENISPAEAKAMYRIWSTSNTYGMTFDEYVDEVIEWRTIMAQIPEHLRDRINELMIRAAERQMKYNK